MKPRFASAGQIAAEASSAAYRTAFAALGGIKETKLRGSQPFFIDAYREASLRGAYAARTAGFISAVPRYLLEILFILAVGVSLVGAVVMSETESSVAFGLLALFIAAGLRALPAVTSLMAQISNLRFGAGFLDVIIDEVRAERAQALEPPRDGAQALRFTDRLTLEDVSFTYPETDVPAVRGVNLDIPHGTSLAVVGGSGAGKTTLIDLVLGLHRPSQGRILVDGRDIEDNISSWQQTVGYVPQEVFLREASLAENIAFDQNPDQIDGDRVNEAIERAQCLAWSRPLRRASRRPSASEGHAYPVDSGSASGLPAQSTSSPRCLFSMRPPQHSTTRPSTGSARLSRKSFTAT